MTTLFSTLNTASVHVARENVVLSQDAIKEIAKATKTTARAVAVQTDIVNAIITRMNHKLETEQKISQTLFTDLKEVSSVSFLHTIDKLQKRKIDLSSIALQFKETNKSNKETFLQVKALSKVYNVLNTIAREDYREFNAYTKSILLNMLEHGSLTINEALRCVSTAINKKDISERDVKAYYQSAASTASTQVSSSRMTLRALNICNIQKGKRDDLMTFNNDEQYTALVLEILQMKENTAEERAKVAEELRKKQLDDAAKKA